MSPIDNRPSFQFYPKDWLSDLELRSVSPEARGAWIDMLCYMWFSPVRGKLVKASGKPIGKPELSRMLGIPEARMGEILDELVGSGVCRTDCDQILYNKRMADEWETYCKRAAAGRKGGSKPRPKPEQSQSKASRGRAHSSPSSSSSSSTDKREKKHETPNGVPWYFHLDPFPYREIRDQLDTLRETMLKIHGKAAVLPAVGSETWFRHLDALEKIVRIDGRGPHGYSASDVIECLLWILTKEKESSNGFCWRDQLKSLAQLRTKKKDGPTKFAQMYAEFRKVVKKAPKKTPAQTLRQRALDHGAVIEGPGGVPEYQWPWSLDGEMTIAETYVIKTEADYEVLVQRADEYQRLRRELAAIPGKS